MSNNSSLSVHDSRKIFLANANVRGVLAIYKFERLDQPNIVERTFFKTFDKSIAVGDVVIVPSTTRHNMTTVKVMAVDVECDLADQTPVNWIIGRIDRRAFEKTLAQEGEMLAIIKKAEKQKMMDDLKATVFANVDENQIKQLTIAKVGSADQIEDK